MLMWRERSGRKYLDNLMKKEEEQICICGHPRSKHIKSDKYCYSYECKCLKYKEKV